MTDNNKLSREGIISLSAIFGFAAIFAVWWDAANPTARLDKIEATATTLAKDVGITYATIRAHEDLQARLLSQLATLDKKEDETRSLALTRLQFEAWREERTRYISEIVKRLDHLEFSRR